MKNVLKSKLYATQNVFLATSLQIYSMAWHSSVQFRGYNQVNSSSGLQSQYLQKHLCYELVHFEAKDL